MANLTQTCTVCQKQFLIIDQEQSFLQQKGLPNPISCPACRQKRRLVMRGERTLAKTECQQCKKEIVVPYDPLKVQNVILCREDYQKYFENHDTLIADPLPEPLTVDSFFKELQRLIILQPKRPSQTLDSTDCSFTNFVYYSRNLYYCFDCNKSSNGTYMYDSHNCADCGDMNFSYENEQCYECVNAYKCFNCTYIDDCKNMTDSDFSSRCIGCHDVFGCFKLENKSFCIFNRQLTESEYHEKVKYLKTLPPEKILAEVEKIKNQYPVSQTNEHDSQNSSYGNYVSFCHNCYMCFDTEKSNDCGYIYDSANNKNSFDVLQSGNIELSYQILDSGQTFNSLYVVFSKNCQDDYYLFDCVDLKNSMGCVMLNHRSYCLLNRQFTKEEYEEKTKNLREELKLKNYEWSNLVY